MRDDAAPRPSAVRSSRWLLPCLLAVVVLALAVALVVVRNQDGRPRADVGALLHQEAQEESLDHSAEVVVPWAGLDIGVEGPREELPDVAGVPANLRAPDDGSFVRVQARVAEEAPAGDVRDPEEVYLVLRADGRDYPLTVTGGLSLDPEAPTEQGGELWIAVEGQPEDLEVRVSVGDERHVVRADGTVESGRSEGEG